MSDTPPALLTRDELLAAESLAALVALYRERGAEGSDDAVLLRAQAEWGRLALEHARGITEEPAALPAEVVERGGTRYAVYGIYHGLVGGGSRDYLDFVRAAVKDLERPLFENGIDYFYRHPRGVTIPDFLVLGALGSVRVGLDVGLLFPRLLWDLASELIRRRLRRASAASGAEDFAYTRRYHAIDAETRRGLDPDGAPLLPSRLQVEYELGEWARAGWLATWRAGAAIVPRSMFMAGFAQGFGESRGAAQVDLVVGDLHTTEVRHFLSGDAPDHEVFRKGLAWGRRSDASRRLGILGAKLAHLTVAGLAGCLILGPAMIGLLFLYRWLVPA